MDFNLTKDSFTDENVRYKTRYAVKLKQMSMKPNHPRSKKKLSRIILPDDDSDEEENTVDDREDSGTHGSTADKLTQQGQQCSLGPPGSSAQPTVLSHPTANQKPTQRPRAVQSVMDALHPKAQDHSSITSTSSPCTEACGQCPVELKVCKKVKKSAIIFI